LGGSSKELVFEDDHGVTPPIPRWLGAGLASAALVAAAARSQREAGRSAQLAEEQAALRRVATLVARRVPPPEVFAAVAREVGRLLGVDATYMARYEPNDTATGVAAWSSAGDDIPVGTPVDLEDENVAGSVFRTGRPARMHVYDHASGTAAEVGRKVGVRASVGAPIVVDDRLWGVMDRLLEGRRVATRRDRGEDRRLHGTRRHGDLRHRGASTGGAARG
jgi:transcriptional regulator with GAF, ATPase, and Fis domain